MFAIGLTGCGQSTSHSNDASLPDSAMLDLSMPDSAMPDLSMPDSSIPDLTTPDSSVPDSAMPDLSMCPSGQSACAGGCVNFDNDTHHCGYCGHACEAGQTCDYGECCNSICGGICCNDQCLGGECCATCADRADYYASRYQHCMDTDSRGAAYCQSWMGCVGPIEVPGYGAVTGTCGQF